MQFYQTALGLQEVCSDIRIDTLAQSVNWPSSYMASITEVGAALIYSNLNRQYHEAMRGLDVCSAYVIRTLACGSSRHGDTTLLVLTALISFTRFCDVLKCLEKSLHMFHTHVHSPRWRRSDWPIE